MSAGLLLIVGAVYCVVAVDYAMHGRYGLCAAFVCYAFANLGFAIDTWSR